MKDWRGVDYAPISEGVSREAIATINDFLYQLSPAIGRIAKGQTPDSSGNTLPALDDFFFLPGRITPQTGFFGTGSGANSGYLSSTKHGTKGKWSLNSAKTITVDEANVLLGVGTFSPTAGIHVIAAPQPSSFTFIPNGAVTYDADWDQGSASPEVVGVVLDGNDSTFWGLGTINTSLHTISVACTTISPGTSYTVNLRMGRTGAGVPAGTMYITVTDSAGTSYQTSFSTTTIAQGPGNYTKTVTTVSGTGTPNTLAIGVQFDSNPNQNIRIQEITTCSGVGSGGAFGAIARFQHTGDSSLYNTEWQNASGTVVGSVTQAGQAQFQNVALEDPGSGTATITHKAPTTPTTHSLVWPTVPTDGGVLQVAYSAPTGTLSWPLPNALATRIQHRWAANGAYTVDTNVDGDYIAPHAITITRLILHRRLAGTSGSTSVAIKKNGTTIDTRTVTAASGNDAVSDSGTLALAVAALDKLTIDTTAKEAGTPKDYDLILEGF